MAGSRRHWKEKNGRFWARIAIPKALQPFLGGRTQLTEPLGGDRTIASQNHAAAVARLQQQISLARAQAGMAGAAGSSTDAASCPPCVRLPLTPQIIQELAHQHYRQVISDYDSNLERMPSLEDQHTEYDRIMEMINTGEIIGSEDPIGAIMAQTDYELMRGAREHDRRLRRSRMEALKVRLGSGDHTLVEMSTNRAVEEHSLAAARGSQDRQMLSAAMVRAAACAEIDEHVDAFLMRPIEAEWPSPWIDTSYLTGRQGGRIVSVALAKAHPSRSASTLMGVARSCARPSPRPRPSRSAPSISAI